MRAQTISRLFSPFNYLRIKHDAKKIYDVTLPIILSSISVIILFTIPVRPPFFGQTGIVTYVSEILKFLSPFYIAALAAVATFDNKSINAEFEGKKPFISEKVLGEFEYRYLNRRQFLCLAFGYLALSSLLMYFIGYIAWIISININFSTSTSTILKIIFSFFYFSAFYNIITTTMLGLFYLSYKLHK